MAQVCGGGLQKQPAAPAMQVEPAGQRPPHCGALDEHWIGTLTQLHDPPAASDLQTVLTGQTPPQSGAGLCVQGIAMSWQPHSVVPGIVRQSWLAGQSPPHCGNGLCEQASGGWLHSQMPAAFGVQLSPGGQAPLHDGAEPLPHCTTMSTQVQWPVTELGLHC